MKRRIVALCAVFASLGLAQAQSLEGLELKPGMSARDVRLSAASAGGECGVALDLGDGTRPQFASTRPDKPAQFAHTFKAPGSYGVLAYGASLPGLFSRTPACQSPRPKVAWVIDPHASEDGSLDLVLLARVRSPRGEASRFATNLDGSLRLSDPRIAVCVSTLLLRDTVLASFDEPPREPIPGVLRGLGQLYRAVEVDNITEVATREADTLLRKLGRQSATSPRCRISDGVDSLWRTDVIALPRGFVAQLAQLPGGAELKQFVPWGELPFEQVRARSIALKTNAATEQQARSAAADEFATLAARSSTARVGSLVFINERASDKQLKVCTVTYKGDEGAAILGYRTFDFDMFLPDTKAQLQAANARFGDNRRGFDKVFGDLNEAFVELTKKPDTCQVFVDFPGNLQTLQNGLQRERRAAPRLGALIDADAARERFATRRGFATWADSQLAATLRAGVNEFNALKAAGITDLQSFEAARSEMLTSGHSTTEDVGTVLTYLRDREEAKTRKVSVIAQRDARLAQEKKEQAKAEAERRKRRAEYVREFPFEAVLSCGFQGRHMQIMACFAGSSPSPDTELEVRNGADYALYRAWELNRAGRESPGEGLVIPLRAQFELKAQNASDTLTLTLTVRETESGKTVYVKSAAQYGIVSSKR